MADSATTPPPAKLRQFQRLGESGPVYEVLSVDEARGIVRIHIFDSGEEVETSLEEALTDPPAP